MKTINLSNNYQTIVDDDDYDELNKFKWSARVDGNKVYAVRKGKPHENCSQISMHRVIMNVCDSKIWVDHIDGNGLNNTRCNLRLATNSQNQLNRGLGKRNTSGYIGVSYHKASNKWRSTLVINGRSIFLGHFSDKESAAIARDNAIIMYAPNYGVLNFPKPKSHE